MAYEQKAGDIAIFRNDRKENDRHPDWKGTMVTPAGEVLEVAVWEKGGKGTMLAGKVSEPRQRRDDAQSFRGGGAGGMAGRDDQRSRGDRFPDVEDDLPFITLNSIR